MYNQITLTYKIHLFNKNEDSLIVNINKKLIGYFRKIVYNVERVGE